MLKVLCNVLMHSAAPLGCIRLGIRKKKHPPQGCQYEHETMWWPCLITISSTNRTIIDIVLANWKQHELTNNEVN